MRRTARLLTGTAIAVAAVGLATAPAYGGSTESLEVLPSTVVPGADVTVNTAACGADGTATGDASAVGAGVSYSPPAPRTGRDRPVQGAAERPAGDVRDRREVLPRPTGHRRPDREPDRHTRADPSAAWACEHGGRRRTGPDPVQTAAGVAALAVAAAGGTWLLHRRARGDGI